MTFTVTYRDKNGQRTQEAFEAESRADLFAQLKERKINALRVDNGKPKVTRSSGVTLSPKFVKIFAAILVVAVCGIAVVMLLPSIKDAVSVKEVAKKPKDKTRTKTVSTYKPESTTETADSATNAVTAVKPGANSSPSNSVEITHDAYGKVVKGKLAKRPPRKKLFKHTCDSQIARVLAIEPGGLIIGTLNYKRNRFEENFKKSLKDSKPVEIKPDDTPEEVALKEAVIAARAELIAAMERGEDIAEIMQETEAELHKMQSYRFELKAELAKIQRDSSYTPQDLEDFTAAANELLAKRGAKPLACPKLWAIKARLKREQQAQQIEENE